jgi:hypothetical protein
MPWFLFRFFSGYWPLARSGTSDWLCALRAESSKGVLSNAVIGMRGYAILGGHRWIELACRHKGGSSRLVRDLTPNQGSRCPALEGQLGYLTRAREAQN